MSRALILCAILSVTAGCATPSQMAVDAEVERLCAIDGGIKVYETVKRPASEFDSDGVLKAYQHRTDTTVSYKQDTSHTVMESSFERGFIIRWEIQTYIGDILGPESGFFSAKRHVFQVKRRADNALLGEAVIYSRRGGDIPGPWHPSSYRCPTTAGDIELIRKVFVK